MIRTLLAVGYAALLALVCVAGYCAGRTMHARGFMEPPLKGAPAVYRCWSPGASTRNIGIAEQGCGAP